MLATLSAVQKLGPSLSIVGSMATKSPLDVPLSKEEAFSSTQTLLETTSRNWRNAARVSGIVVGSIATMDAAILSDLVQFDGGLELAMGSAFPALFASVNWAMSANIIDACRANLQALDRVQDEWLSS